MTRARVVPPASGVGGAERASIPMSVLIESLSPIPHSLFEVSFSVFFLGLGILLVPVLCTAFGRWPGFRRHLGMPALRTQGAEEGEEEQERLRVRAYNYLESNRQLFAENQRLRNALAFYATQENWQSPSTDFARRYNPHPSAVDRDGGQRACIALTEPTAADARQ
jgi:hypothetical protein